MSRLILIPVILALAAASPAFADDEDYARNGFYGSFKIAGNHYTKIEQDVKSDIEGAGYAGQVTAEGPLGLDVRAGYRFHPHLGADIEFLWFTKSTTEFTGTTSENPNIKNDNFDVFKVETLNFFGNLKGYILTGRIQPFAQVGVGLMHAKIDDKLSLNTLKGGLAGLVAGRLRSLRGAPHPDGVAQRRHLPHGRRPRRGWIRQPALCTHQQLAG